MKHWCFFLSVYISLFSCSGPAAQSEYNTSLNSDGDSDVTIETHDFKSSSIHEFFQLLISYHKTNLLSKNKALFEQFCSDNSLIKNDSINIQHFLEIKLLHDLLTAQGAVNGSTGDILNIPYFWHWTKPNPRHSIHSVPKNKLLNTIKPPSAYGKYATHADIDRTPALFWSELFAENPLYYHASCDTFNTFGWCSEREMAYVCMMEIFGHSGEIIVSGNHSWSEIESSFIGTDNQTKKIIFSVDNTFNGISWNDSQKNKTIGPTTKWYNDKASSEKEKLEIKSIIVLPSVAGEIEARLIRYLSDPTKN